MYRIENQIMFSCAVLLANMEHKLHNKLFYRLRQFSICILSTRLRKLSKKADILFSTALR